MRNKGEIIMRILTIIILLSAILVSLGIAKTGGGDISFKGGSAGDVIFRHDSHAMDGGSSAPIATTAFTSPGKKIRGLP